jgi:hypothetical protein
VSKYKSTIAVAAIVIFCGDLLAQPRADDLSARQPLAFQAVSQAFRPAADTAYEEVGIDHTILLSAQGDLELRLPSAGALPALHIGVLGARENPILAPEEQLSGTAFEYIGNDASKWRRDIPLYAKLRYSGIYPGIDLVYHGTQGQLEFDFVVNPGSDPRTIRIALRGAAGAQETTSGGLLMSSSAASISLGRPVAYQSVAGQNRNINASYRLLSTSPGAQAVTEVAVDLGAYDPSVPVVIDPIINWTIYPKPPGLIGNDSSGKAVAVGTDGNVWVAGWQWYSYSGNANQHSGYLAKLTPDGQILRRGRFGGYSCEVVGDPYGDEALGMAADTSGGAWVVGWTSCSDFPTANAYQPNRAGNRDAFVVHFPINADYLISSTFLGGASEEIAYGVGVNNASGEVWVTGRTGSTGFPLLGWYGGYGGGTYDAFASRYNGAGQLVFSRFLGGSSDDTGYNLAVDPYGNAYLVGMTFSSNFPLANATQWSSGGNSDAFVTKLDGGGNMLFSTFLGGSGIENAFGIAADSSQNIWVGGRTGSTNFPLLNPLLSAYRGGPSDAFISRYVFNGSGYTYDFGTFMGGSDNDVVYGLGIDPSGRVWISGQTFSYNWPCTPDAFQSTRPGTYAGFLSRIDYYGWYSYGFGSYFPQGDPVGYQASRLAIDSSGVVYITGDRYGYNLGMWLTKVTP